MSDLHPFHAILDELMQHLGLTLAPSVLAPGQAVVGLAVDDRFTLSFELIDDDCWLMLADLGPSNLPCDGPPQARRLRDCPMEVGDWQPMLALDDHHHLTCGLLLPLHGAHLPVVLDAFDLLVATAERILDGPPIHLNAGSRNIADHPDRLPGAMRQQLASPA